MSAKCTIVPTRTFARTFIITATMMGKAGVMPRPMLVCTLSFACQCMYCTIAHSLVWKCDRPCFFDLTVAQFRSTPCPLIWQNFRKRLSRTKKTSCPGKFWIWLWAYVSYCFDYFRNTPSNGATMCFICDTVSQFSEGISRSVNSCKNWTIFSFVFWMGVRMHFHSAMQ